MDLKDIDMTVSQIFCKKPESKKDLPNILSYKETVHFIEQSGEYDKLFSTLKEELNGLSLEEQMFLIKAMSNNYCDRCGERIIRTPLNPNVRLCEKCLKELERNN